MARLGDRSEMEAFVRAVDLGSFSAAARELDLTPSALSKLVTRLESSLGVKLLIRSTRELRATPEGELLLARCRRILAEIEDAENELTNSIEHPRGTLRLHAGVGFGTHQLVPVLPLFLARYADVRVELMLEDRAVDLAREHVDISVWPGEPEDTSLVARKLCEFERVVCASPAYLQRHGVPQTAADLKQHNCITLSGLPAALASWSMQPGAQAKGVDVSGNVAVNNAECVRHLALQGVGVARLNRFMVSDDLDSGRLQQVMHVAQPVKRQSLYMLYPPLRQRLPRVAVMLAFLAEHFSRPHWAIPSSATSA